MELIGGKFHGRSISSDISKLIRWLTKNKLLSRSQLILSGAMLRGHPMRYHNQTCIVPSMSPFRSNIIPQSSLGTREILVLLWLFHTFLINKIFVSSKKAFTFKKDCPWLMFEHLREYVQREQENRCAHKWGNLRFNYQQIIHTPNSELSSALTEQNFSSIKHKG